MDESRLPDPTPLTTAQLQREITALEKLLTQRMDSLAKAVDVAHENLVRVPTEVQKAIEHLSEVTAGKLDAVTERFKVHEEKFTAVEKQFIERDVRTEQSTVASKEAIGAALQAAKEAVGEQNKSSALAIGKSEAATDKRIDQQALLIQAVSTATDSKIGDIKERLSLIAGTGAGMRQGWSILVAAIGAVVGLLGIAAYLSK